METDRIGITNQVQPMDRHALAEMRRRKQSIDLLLIRLGAAITGEGSDLVRRWRQPGQIKAQAANQGRAIRRAHRRQSHRLQLASHEMIDPHGAVRARTIRSARALGRNVGPVRFILRALLDPASKQVFLRSAQRKIRVGRRHHFHWIRRKNARHHLAGSRIARHDRSRRDRLVSMIQPKIRLTGVAVRTVALEAVLREYGPDVAVKPYRLAAQDRGRTKPKQAGPKQAGDEERVPSHDD